MMDVFVLLVFAAVVALVSMDLVEKHVLGAAVLALLLFTGALSPVELYEAVEWDVLGVVAGMSLLTGFLRDSGFGEAVSKRIVSRVRSPRLLFFTLILLSGFISLFLDNVSTVSLMGLVVFYVAKEAGLNPVDLFIGVALAAGMSGSATMVGDPPAMIVAGYFNLSFLDFFFYRGRPSMFFITVAAMLASTLVYTLFHSGRSRVQGSPSAGGEGFDKVYLAEASASLTVTVALLSVRNVLGLPLTLCVSAGLALILAARLLVHRDYKGVLEVARGSLEWRLPVFIASVFALSAGLLKYGWIDRFVAAVLSATGGGFTAVSSVLIGVSVLASAFIDNTPYIVASLPLTSKLATAIGADPVALAWALLLGTTLGGCITPIGASSNMVAVGILEMAGHRVSFTGFVKKALAFNMVNVLTGWLIYLLAYSPP